MVIAGAQGTSQAFLFLVKSALSVIGSCIITVPFLYFFTINVK